MVDDLIELRTDRARHPADPGRTLVGLWRLLDRVMLVEFKSVSREFRRGDLFRLEPRPPLDASQQTDPPLKHT